MWVHEILKACLLPPLAPLLLVLPWLCLGGGRRALALALALSYVSSLPLTAVLLTRLLATADAPLRLPPSPWSLVVLGGGRLTAAREYSGDGPSAATLQRLRYAAALARSAPAVPVWLSGGRVYGEDLAEATLMQRSLQRDFALPLARLHGEDVSRNTAENAAQLAAHLGRGARVLVVTDALHMPRALHELRCAGLQAWPAPLAGYRPPPFLPLLFLPQAQATASVDHAIWEGVGRLVRWRCFSSPAAYANL